MCTLHERNAILILSLIYTIAVLLLFIRGEEMVASIVLYTMGSFIYVFSEKYERVLKDPYWTKPRRSIRTAISQTILTWVGLYNLGAIIDTTPDYGIVTSLTILFLIVNNTILAIINPFLILSSFYSYVPKIWMRNHV